MAPVAKNKRLSPLHIEVSEPAFTLGKLCTVMNTESELTQPLNVNPSTI